MALLLQGGRWPHWMLARANLAAVPMASLACLQGGRAARHDKTFCLWLLAGKLAPKKQCLQGEFPCFTKHCHPVAAVVPSKAHLGCLDVVSVKEQCCCHLSQGLTVTSNTTAKQHTSQNFLLPCYTGAFHYSLCRILTLLTLSIFLQFLS